MEQLPTDIEQKIENLPIIALDAGDEFQNLIFSQEFTDIFNFYKKNYLPDVLKTKPELYQRVSLYLTLTNQDTAFLEQTDQVLYKRHCPTIEEFLDNKFYMGYSNATLYPYWKERLMEIFAPNSPIRKTIFGGSIGVGKSTVARKAFLYVLYRVLCLRYPRAVFNVDADATLMAMIISMTLQQVYETNMLPFTKLLETMPCFQKVMSMRSFENFDLTNDRVPIPYVVEKSTATIYFPDNIIIGCGSGMNHTIGKNLFTTFLDEMNEKGVEDALELLNSVDNRFSSRFAGVDLVFQSIVSSARTTNSPIGEYIKRLPKNDPSILILSPKLWDIKTDPAFLGDGSTFPVMVGNGSIPSKIITDPGELKAIEDGKYIPPTGCEIIQVPTVYKSKFELQLDQSIQDIAGMTTSDNNSVFRDTTLLQDTELTPEIQLEANLKDNTDLLACLPPGIFEKNLQGKWQFCRAPLAERYVHLDLSGGGSDGQCDSGICVLHKEWQLNPMTNQKDTIYVVDLIIAVNAKNKIDLQAIQNFIINLVAERNVNIHTVSADQYQSKILLDTFEVSGYFTKVEKVSVDMKPEPYLNASRLIESGMVKIGTCPKLIKELEALIWQKGKVTRTTELKDMCLSGNTKIPLLSGKTIPIADLMHCYKNEYVLGYDLNTNKLTPIKIKKVIDKGVHDNLYKITLDNGKVIVCTDDHLILKKDKTYVKANNLKVGDSLLPITIFDKQFGTKKYKSDYNYKAILDPDTHKQKWLHRVIADFDITGKESAEQRKRNDNSKYLIIHHIDHNKFNNNPSNLEWLTLKEHRKLHGDIFTVYNKSEKHRKRTSELCKAGKCGFKKLYLEKPEIIKEIAAKNGKETFIKYNKSKEKWVKINKRRKEDPVYNAWYKERLGKNFKNQSPEMIQKRIASFKNNTANIIRCQQVFSNMNKNPIIKKKQKISKLKKLYALMIKHTNIFTNTIVTLEMFKQGIQYLKENKIINTHYTVSLKYEDIIEAGIPLTNHKVVKIEKLNTKERVYDIQLDTVHNFMIDSGIFVHNCDALTGAIYNAQLNYTDQPQTMYINSKVQEKEFEYTDLIDTHLQQLEDI